MPRLLLVDDNPSIHKIAETLLAASDIQLVSCGSGDQAMALVNQGDRFDVALLDTTMLGMDGWALLQLLRETEATAKMPVAMMAGVLDIVDPEKLRVAPIQGFLKKPVELRDLGDRVRRLLETPVLPPHVPAPPPPAPAAEDSPFLTQPGLRIPDLLLQPAPDPDILLLGPEDLLDVPSAEEPEVEAPAAEPTRDHERTVPEAAEGPDPGAALPAEAEQLDLEELDLDGLRDLSLPESAFPPEPDAPFADALPEPEVAAAASAFTEDLPAEAVPEFLPADAVPDFAPEDAMDAGQEPGPGEPLDWSDDSDSLVLPTQPPAEPSREAALDAFTAEDFLDAPEVLDQAEAVPEPEAWPSRTEDPAGMQDVITLDDLLDEPAPTAPAEAPLEPTVPEAPLAAAPEREEELTLPDFTTLSDFLDVPLADGLAPEPAAFPETGEAEAGFEEPGPALPGAAPAAAAAENAPAPGAGPDLVAALLADPVLLDRLAKALVTRLGDQVLREIAWEVMPELAERLHQQALP